MRMKPTGPLDIPELPEPPHHLADTVAELRATAAPASSGCPECGCSITDPCGHDACTTCLGTAVPIPRTTAALALEALTPNNRADRRNARRARRHRGKGWTR